MPRGRRNMMPADPTDHGLDPEKGPHPGESTEKPIDPDAAMRAPATEAPPEKPEKPGKVRAKKPEGTYKKTWSFESRAAGLKVFDRGSGNNISFANHHHNTQDERVANVLKGCPDAHLVSLCEMDEYGNVREFVDADDASNRPWQIMAIEAGSDYDTPSRLRRFSTKRKAQLWLETLGGEAANYEIVWRGSGKMPEPPTEDE